MTTKNIQCSDASINADLEQEPAPLKVTRRAALASLSAILGTGLLPLTGYAAPDSTPSLAALASAKGMRFGSAVGMVTGGFYSPAIKELLIRECNIIVPENELKMVITHPSPGANDYNFSLADNMLAFCATNNMAMRGHTLLWCCDEYSPNWMQSYDFGPKPTVEAERLLREYIGRVVEHYGDRLTSWDVINEAVDPKTGEVRDSVFFRVLGMDTFRICYETVREHLPKTQLVYNDYMSWEAGNELHRKGVLKLLHWFRKHKIPVDALGVQSHLGSDYDLLSIQSAQWKKFLDETVAMGYDLVITEFDVDDLTIPISDISARDAKIAEVARGYLEQMFSYKQLKDVLVWGIADKYHYLQSVNHRKDKLHARPTLYDEDFQPKRLREVMADTFKAAARR